MALKRYFIRRKYKPGKVPGDFTYRIYRLSLKLSRIAIYILVIFVFSLGPAHCDPLGTCSDDLLRGLITAIEQHNEHAFRLNKKFKDIWYPQGPVPPEVAKEIGIDDIRHYLASLGRRKTAVLFHGFDHGSLRTWLILYNGTIICAPPIQLRENDWQALQPAAWNELGVRGAAYPRTAIPIDNGNIEQHSADRARKWDAVLQRLSEILLPHQVVDALEVADIDTLVIVPITVREFNPAIDIDEQSSATRGEDTSSALNIPFTRAALSIGVVPFAALPVGDDVLINTLSVVIAPGFFAFAQPPLPVRQKYSKPVVAGNPSCPGFQALPGAEAEAKKVADLLRTDRLFINKRATKTAVDSFVRQNADSVDFIYLATHGIADAVNPVDESFLVFSDGVWNAREISSLRYYPGSGLTGSTEKKSRPLLKAKPLVVMSACQTALGKDFPAGTIGLARAWHWAGASNVVMSLWSVDDLATKELMEHFVERIVQGEAVDKALQNAMRQLRDRPEYASPSNWASFSIYGAPERLISNGVSRSEDR